MTPSTSSVGSVPWGPDQRRLSSSRKTDKKPVKARRGATILTERETKKLLDGEKERFARKDRQKETIRKEQRKVHWKQHLRRWSSAKKGELSPIAQSMTTNSPPRRSGSADTVVHNTPPTRPAVAPPAIRNPRIPEVQVTSATPSPPLERPPTPIFTRKGSFLGQLLLRGGLSAQDLRDGHLTTGILAQETRYSDEEKTAFTRTTTITGFSQKTGMPSQFQHLPQTRQSDECSIVTNWHMNLRRDSVVTTSTDNSDKRVPTSVRLVHAGRLRLNDVGVPPTTSISTVAKTTTSVRFLLTPVKPTTSIRFVLAGQLGLRGVEVPRTTSVRYISTTDMPKTTTVPLIQGGCQVRPRDATQGVAKRSSARRLEADETTVTSLTSTSTSVPTTAVGSAVVIINSGNSTTGVGPTSPKANGSEDGDIESRLRRERWNQRAQELATRVAVLLASSMVFMIFKVTSGAMTGVVWIAEMVLLALVG